MKRIAIALAALGTVSAADAATIVATTTVDLRALTFSQPDSYLVQGPAFTPISVTLAAGDTFDFTIRFKGTEALTLVDPTLLWGYAYAAVNEPATDVTGTGSLTLLDAFGQPVLTSLSKTDTEGQVHFGQQFRTPEFTGGLSPVLTFSGLRYIGTLDAYADPTVSSRLYDSSAFFFQATSATVAGSAPEPATWALFVAGFGLVGAAVRRRAARTTVSC